MDGEESAWYCYNLRSISEGSVRAERPRRREGSLESLPAAAVQPLAECPVQLLKHSKLCRSSPRSPRCCWDAVPGMVLNRTISSLLCCLAPSRRADIWREEGLGDNSLPVPPGRL